MAPYRGAVRLSVLAEPEEARRERQGGGARVQPSGLVPTGAASACQATASSTVADGHNGTNPNAVTVGAPVRTDGVRVAGVVPVSAVVIGPPDAGGAHDDLLTRRRPRQWAAAMSRRLNRGIASATATIATAGISRYSGRQPAPSGPPSSAW